MLGLSIYQMRAPWVLIGVLLLSRCASAMDGGPGRSMITIENEKAEDDAIDPDEYLWETLPGRCCFMQNGDDCDMCNVWSDPQNFCHTSRESCELCGMSLYCPAPPPLLNANKVCKGESRVGEGCNDDLDTGLCQKSGALAACQAACRHTQHCEMIVLYTDSMAGSCVLCRNMLNYDMTEQASTRIYAVTHLDMNPPSPPGYQQEMVKHFSILKDPNPPPPPLPPPRPPRRPPPPLPAQLGMHADAHIECEFFDDVDYTVIASPGVSTTTTDTAADTKKHCCCLCGMQAGCTDFVFEPASKTCVLMPHVPSYNLRRSPNNSTIAGSVTISRIDNSHAACHFEVGSGYAGGTVGVGKPLPGHKMDSKQDCCDACERDPRCAKFVFEHYGGDCQLFGPQAEKYLTFSLLSGTVDGRATGDMPSEGSLPDQNDDDELDMGPWGGGGESTRYGDHGSVAPPVPPMLTFFAAPPPASKASSESAVATAVLADFSLGIGFLIFVVFSLFAYLFFASDIQKLLFHISGGRFGKQTRSLLPTRQPDSELTPAFSKRKKGALPVGWAKVTVQTSQVTQKKDMEVAECATLEELKELMWDEFSHLLKATRAKDMLLLVWVDSSDDDGNAGNGRWELVTEASNMARVTASPALKLAEKKAFDIKTLAIAFIAALTNESHRHSSGRRAPARLLALKGPPSANDSNSDASDDEAAPQGSSKTLGRGPRSGGIAGRFARGASKGGFQPLDSIEDEESGSDLDAAPLCGQTGPTVPAGPNKARGAVNGRRAGRNAKELASNRACGRERGSSGRRPAIGGGANEANDVEHGVDLLGKRVVVHGLVTQGKLNGRAGVATSFDKAKVRYRVRLEAADGEVQTLAFKPENLMLRSATAGT